MSSVGMCAGKLVREVQTEEEEPQKARSAYMCCERYIQLSDYVHEALCLLSVSILFVDTIMMSLV